MSKEAEKTKFLPVKALTVESIQKPNVQPYDVRAGDGAPVLKIHLTGFFGYWFEFMIGEA